MSIEKRLESEAIGALTKAGICTPEEGYIKLPYLLSGDITRLAQERDEAREESRQLRDALEYTQHFMTGSFNDGWTIRLTGHQMDYLRAVLGLPSTQFSQE